MSTTTPETSTDLDVIVSKAVDKINAGSMSMADLLQALAPKAFAETAPAIIPPVSVLTKEQIEAIERVAEVFGKVAPAERRLLTTDEITGLVEEKQTLDELKKMAESRLGDVRTIVFNHLDVEAEATEGFDPETTIRESKGFYAIKGAAQPAPGTSKKFTREVTQKAPTLSAEMLEALAEDPESDFTRDDYLAMTTQVRVVDENKVMLTLKKNPALVRALAQATQPGPITASCHLRKA